MKMRGSRAFGGQTPLQTMQGFYQQIISKFPDFPWLWSTKFPDFSLTSLWWNQKSFDEKQNQISSGRPEAL